MFILSNGADWGYDGNPPLFLTDAEKAVFPADFIGGTGTILATVGRAIPLQYDGHFWYLTILMGGGLLAGGNLEVYNNKNDTVSPGGLRVFTEISGWVLPYSIVSYSREPNYVSEFAGHDLQFFGMINKFWRDKVKCSETA